MSAREPALNPVPLKDLRPTQMTVGLREVAERRRQWRERSDARDSQFLGRHMVPVVLGPKARPYLIDHHHLCRALADEGVETVLANVVADLRRLKKAEFWVFLDNRSWCHPYDGEGRRRDFDRIPDALADLADDPYRSLAGDLRRAGGYAKDSAPFAEFVWADFLRRRVRRKLVSLDYPAALTRSLKLARSDVADHLPGWCGPDPIA